MSPTDANLSPCSQKLWGKRRPSHSDLKARQQPRQWESAVLETSDGETSDADDDGDRGGGGGAPSSSGDDDSAGGGTVESGAAASGRVGTEDEDEEEDVVVVEDGDGAGAFFTNRAELEVGPRPPPTSLPIIVGSSSANRRTVVKLLGWDVQFMSPDINEKAIRRADPRELCLAVAHAKAAALADRQDAVPHPAVLITADQVVIFEGEMREKPGSLEEARTFLRSYSERRVSTFSAVVATNTEDGRQAGGVDAAAVAFGRISDEVVESVLARGAVLSSAGGFSLEDPELGPLARRVDGAVDSVYGLPVDLMCALIREVTATAPPR